MSASPSAISAVGKISPTPSLTSVSAKESERRGDGASVLSTRCPVLPQPGKPAQYRCTTVTSSMVSFPSPSASQRGGKASGEQVASACCSSVASSMEIMPSPSASPYIVSVSAVVTSSGVADAAAEVGMTEKKSMAESRTAIGCFMIVPPERDLNSIILLLSYHRKTGISSFFGRKAQFSFL